MMILVHVDITLWLLVSFAVLFVTGIIRAALVVAILRRRHAETPKVAEPALIT